MLVIATSILGIRTLLTAEPNLPLYTAADTICDLLREASDPVRAQYARLLAQNIPVSTPIDYGQEDRANLFQENSPLRCVLITQGGLLRQLCHSYSHLSTFKKVRLAFNDESQQGGKAGFTVIGANLPCSCLQCLTGDQEQTKAGTGGEKLQEALVDQLAHKAIGFLGGSKPHLPSSMLLSLFKALRTAQVSNLPSDRDSPFDLLQYLCESSLPFSCLPATVWEAEGMVPTAGVTLHLILPHSLRCPADTYFTQVAMHYPHLQYSSGQTVAFGHYEDPLPDQMATKLPVDFQNVPYHCSGYRLLHWSPRLSPGSNKLPPDDVANIIKVAATLSYYVAKQVRRNQESSKLLILTPHNDTVDDILDAVGLPPDNLPPSLYEFYLVMIYKQQILPTTLTEFTRADHRGKPYTPHLENVTFKEIHTKISNDPTLHQDLARRATIDTIVQIALDFPKGFSSYCTISNTVKAIGIGGVASVFVSCKISDFLTKTKEAQARNLVALTRSKGLCILLLPSTDRFSTSSLHSLRTLCAFRHGMFSIGASPIDIPKLGAFITQPDVIHEGTSSIHTAETWQIAHQISWYGTWHCLPLALGVSYAKHTFYFTLSLRTGVVPSSNVHQLDASAFEWKGSLPNHPSATISFAKDGLVLQAQYPMVLFPFPAGRGSTSILSTNPKGYSLRPVSGTYFFANASFNTGHTHPLGSGLHDPDDIALPPQMIRWPRESPAVLPVALATQSQRNPVPSWLPADSKTLYQQGLEALTTEDALHNANPTHWLPAYCAHALQNFAEEHLSVLANPDTLASFSTEVVDPLLRSETSKAQEYLQGLLSTADSGYKTVLRRRPVPLTDGPPNDDYIVSINIASLKTTRLYIDMVYRKIAELATFLAGSDIPKSPDGWVRLQTLQSYDGRDVPGNFNPTTQNVIATNKFCVLSHGSLRPMSKDVLETLLILDFQARGKGRRFQYATYGPPAPEGGRTIKEYAVRLAPSVQAAAGPDGPATPSTLVPPQYGAYFCSDSMLEPLKRYGINPKTRSRDGYAVKLHPLTSCDPQAIADALANSTLRGPQADTLLLVDIPSTRGSHTWTLTPNGLLGTYTAPIPPFHFHSAWQDPAQPMWTNPERHRSSSAPAQPTYFSTSAPTVRDDLLNVQADGRLAAHLRETPAPHIMEEDAEPNEDLTGNDFTYSHDTTTAFQELLSIIDSNTKELPNVLSTKHYAALTQLPLTYPWARLVLDLKELLISFDRHLITCLIANQVQGNATPHPCTVLSSFLHHLAQTILLIIAPPGTDDAPPFLHHPEIYGTEFWHAHLNYACTRFAASHGSDRLLGNQICHWTTGTSETCLKVTHLVVFLPPALGAYVLSQHRTKVSSSLSSTDDVSMQDEPHTLRINQSSLLTPPAVIKHQAEQIANARRRAAEGSLAPYTIPLLANTQTRSSKNRVTWTLKFTLPAPAVEGTTRRFSAVPRGYGPSGAHALEGAVRYAYPFDYQHEATTLLPNSDFLALPDHVTQYGPVRAQTLGLFIPDSIKEWLLSGAPRIYDRKDLELPGNRQIALPSILTRYFCSELTIQQFEALIIAKEADNDKELDVAATACRKMKRAKQTLARLPHPDASSTITSASLASAPLGTTPPPSPRIPDTGRSRTPPPDRPRPIGMHPGPPTTEPSSSSGRHPSPAPPPRTVYGGFELGPVKGKPSPQVTMGTGKGPAKGSKGDDSTPAQDTPFFTVAPQTGKDFAPKGGKKGKNKGKDKGKDKGGHKGKGKGKGKDYKG